MNPEIALKPVEFEDLQLLKSYRNNPNIMRWCRQYKLLSFHDQKEWYKKINDSDEIEMRVIVAKKENQSITNERNNLQYIIIGVCGLTSIDFINRRAEFSLYIAPEYQGHGNAKAALIKLFKFGFDDLNLNIIWGESFEGNPAINIFKKMMFEEGKRRQFYYKNGKYVNAVLYSITKNEYNDFIQLNMFDKS